MNIKEKNATLHKDLGLKNPIWDHEFDYIEEYLSCTKPIAETLDILQGENDIYYGILLPTLLVVRRKLQKLTKKIFVYCTPLAEVYVASVERRFEDFLIFQLLKQKMPLLHFYLILVLKTNGFLAPNLYIIQNFKIYLKPLYLRKLFQKQILVIILITVNRTMFLILILILKMIINVIRDQKQKY